MRNAATWTILACAAYVALDVKTNSQLAQPAITFERDRDDSGLAAPYVVQIDDLASDVVQSIASGCECNCDGKCMEQIAELRAEIETLKVQCANCGNGPKPLQSQLPPSTSQPAKTTGRVIYSYPSTTTRTYSYPQSSTSRSGCANGNCSRPTRRFRLFR